MPIGTTEDRLVGSIDLAATLAATLTRGEVRRRRAGAGRPRERAEAVRLRMAFDADPGWLRRRLADRPLPANPPAG